MTMVRTSLVLACVLGLGLSVAPAQDTREKAPARSAEKGPGGLPVVRPLPAPGTAPSPAPGGSPSSPRVRSGTDSKYRQYAESMLKQYDKNNNGALEKGEWSQMSSTWREADRNGDGVITVDELTARLGEMIGRVPVRRGPSTLPPPASVEMPSMGRAPSSGKPPAEMLGMSPEPLDPRAPTVGLRVLVAELAADLPWWKSPPPGQAPAGSLPASKLEGLVDLDLSASNEKLKEDLGKMGLRGRWESFRNVQLASAEGQVAYFQVGQSEPEIIGMTMTTFGRSNSIRYQNTGFVLGVQPHVDPGGIITVNVNVNASRIGSDEEGVPIWVSEKGETVTSRPVHTMVSRSVVRVPDGKTVAVAKVDRDVYGRRRGLIVFLSAQVVQAKSD